MAAINAGIEQGLFDMAPDGIFWAGWKPDWRFNGGIGEVTYRFTMAGRPALASVRDRGRGELTFNVILAPNAEGERLIGVSRPLSHVGDAAGSYDIERVGLPRLLHYHGKPAFRSKREVVAVLDAVRVRPNGYTEDYM